MRRNHYGQAVRRECQSSGRIRGPGEYGMVRTARLNLTVAHEEMLCGWTPVIHVSGTGLQL